MYALNHIPTLTHTTPQGCHWPPTTHRGPGSNVQYHREAELQRGRIPRTPSQSYDFSQPEADRKQVFLVFTSFVYFRVLTATEKDA